MPGKRKAIQHLEATELPQVPVLTNEHTIKAFVELTAPIDDHLNNIAEKIAKEKLEESNRKKQQKT